MYRPPENSNRVKEIKSKFENVERSTKTLSRQSSDPAKRNIKRTPAFRIDLNQEKTQFDRNASCNRSFYFEKVHQFKSCDKKTDEKNEKEKPPLIKSKSSLDFHVLRNKFAANKEDKKDCEDEKDLSHLYAQPKKPPKPEKSEINSESLTDTLKAALKKPLPPGPAPKKPPRTFEHGSTPKPPKNSSFLHNEVKVVKTDTLKHDPRYMLSKLENALRNNKIKARRVKEAATSGEDSDDSLLSKSKSLNRPINLSTNAFNLNCLNGLTCSTYDRIREPSSNFFVSCKPEPVYAEPFVFEEQEVKKTEALKNLKNEQKTAKSLYYLSTPVLCNDQENKMDQQRQTLLDDSSSQSSALSTPVEVEATFETSVKSLIDSFETKKNQNCERIEELKMSLQKTLDKCFENEDERKISVDNIVNKFQSYVKTMPKYRTPKLNQDDRLFYCCLVVGWDCGGPRIKLKYPSFVKLPEKMADLVYPEAASGPLDISDNAQCYSLVITNDKGERTFGYCRRVIPEGSSKCIPLAYCILSKHRAPRFYKKILIELESRHGIPDKMRDELIAKFYNNKFPKPGQSVKINLQHILNESRCTELDLHNFVHVDMNGGYATVNDVRKTSLELTLHQDTRYEEADLKTLHKLPSNILLKIFASLLLERKVILISCVMSQLSCCVDALQSILYPFSWPHTFIPILPQCLWDVVESPTPVICGILNVAVVNEHRIENGIVVDLDECDIISAEGDEDSILSDSMKRAWQEGIDLANTVPSEAYVHSVYLSDAYIKVFIAALKHYKNHISDNIFDRESFIKSAKTKGIRRFLKWFTETTMFLTFIDTVINNPESFSLFDQKIEMYGSDESNVILTKLRGWKK